MLVTNAKLIVAPAFSRRLVPLSHKSSFSLPACMRTNDRIGRISFQRSGRQIRGRSSAVVAIAAACKSEERSTFGALEVHRIACLSDNYAWLIRDQGSAKTAIVDPSESGALL